MVRITAAAVLAFAISALALEPNDAGAKSVGAGDGSQFITGGCVNDADCSSACCAEISGSGLGICSAEAASEQNGKLGCGFVDPNADATIQAAQAQVEKQGF
ncbi:biotrophy-associated secreted protein 2 [Diaporthe helianthi]|uniref:Biotrophy-associated secreted protein 2 n=1 Tax=Diaporthe helianthi TaxID=158607 RepID=A0A2P5HFZ6_DIAHE|nr:biotrophy-associated secreted protein 2 [Diaporthe helianthi]